MAADLVRSFTQDFWRLWLPLAALVIAVAALLGWEGVSAEATRELAEERREADVATAAVAERLAPLAQHLQALARDTRVRAAYSTPMAATLDGMADAFILLMNGNPSYAQARWIDPAGRERLRVDMTPAGARRVPDSGLQTKAARYYVTEAMALPAGSLYASEFDLNIEHEVIEQPHRPMFREVISIRSDDGRPAGLLAINVEGSSILQVLDRHADGTDVGHLMVNARGDFLRALRPEDEFAFMVGAPVRLADREPALWALMQDQAAGQVVGDDAIWAWHVLYPVPGRQGGVHSSNATPWFIVSRRPDAALRATDRRMLGVTTLVTVLVLLLVTGLAWRSAREKKQLRAARLVAETATLAKAEFLANMSHEIRTPMNAIIGLTHLMRREVTDARHLDRLAKVDGAAQHLLRLLNDILDLSKVEAQKMLLEEVDFSLDTLTKGALDMVAPAARDKGLELVLDTDHVPDQIRGDPTRLSQAILNLLTNAVKFTAHGWVRLRVVRVADDGTRFQVRFEVTDTGEGISPEVQARLFRTFGQADTSTTRRHGGSGLGLSLTRAFARLMGGEAGVVSQPGQGSTFWFTAFLARGGMHRDASPLLSSPGLRVLLVDDLPQAAAVLESHILRFGLQVDTFDSGAAAVDKVQAEAGAGRRYDVMLLDWKMSPMDGMQTLARLRATLAGPPPPAILITQSDEAGLLERARAAGFDAMLVKPISASDLHDVLVQQLRLGTQVPAPPVAPLEEGERRVRLRHAGRRILLAEDNPVNRLVATELLRVVGLSVESATNGAEAVDMALSGHYDLILMDMQMPVVDGLAAAREIRVRATQGGPIIAMTAGATPEDRAACLDAGMDDHLSKPVHPAALYAMLLRWLPQEA